MNVKLALACAVTVLSLDPVQASPIELTARPAGADIVDWGQLGTPTLQFGAPQSFTSVGGITGTINFTTFGLLFEQCCIGLDGTFDGDFAPGDKVFLGGPEPLTIIFYQPVQSVGAQIQDNRIGDHFIAQLLAFSGSTLLATFTENGFSGDVGNNSNIFLGVQDSIADITSVTYLTFTNSPTFSLQDVAINQMSLFPVPSSALACPVWCLASVACSVG